MYNTIFLNTTYALSCKVLNGQKKKYKRDKQQSTKYTHTTKDRVTRTPLKTRSELMCTGRVGSFCSTSGTRGVSSLQLGFPYCSFKSIFFLIKYIKKMGWDPCCASIYSFTNDHEYVLHVETIPGSFLIHDLSQH
jgi:hypothetical protein